MVVLIEKNNNSIENEKMARHEIIKILNTTFEEEPVKVDSDLYFNLVASV